MNKSPLDLRREYAQRDLHEADVDPDPFVQFNRWLDEAAKAEVKDANAFILATATPDGLPAARTMLLRGADAANGFVFFTNRQSAKARDIEANPRACLCFLWKELERQVRVTGRVERVDDTESDAYFAQRPRGSQLGAWASPQSEVIATRDNLEAKIKALDQKFAGADVPRPPFWGGYRVLPDTVELWQGRAARLHDRLRYRRDGERWIIERLAP
jgi:pyridoxamine 5'-phosphate oxidase